MAGEPQIQTQNDTLADSPVVCIAVGPAKTKFLAHMSRICQYPYFKAALEGQFQEAETKTIELEGVEPGIFEMLLNWVYAPRLSSVSCHGNDEYVKYLKLWILADRLLMRELQNQIIDALHRSDKPSVCDFNLKPWNRFVWDNTSEDSKLRSFLVERLVLRCSLVASFKNRSDMSCPQEMLVRIIHRVGEIAQNHTLTDTKLWAALDLCRFHEHAEGKKRGEKRKEKPPAPKQSERSTRNHTSNWAEGLQSLVGEPI